MGQGDATRVLFAPGNEQTMINIKGNYRRLILILAGLGLSLEYIQPDWDNGGPADWINQMTAAALNTANMGLPIALGGFSFGAVAVLASAARLESEHGVKVLCVVAASPPPYLAETLPHLLALAPQEASNLRPEVLAELRELRMPPVGCPVHVLVGQKEDWFMHMAAGMCWANYSSSGGAYRVAPHVDHNVLDERYLRAVVAVIRAALC